MPTLVSTGQLTITDAMDGINARLSSEAHVVPASTDGSTGDFTGCSTTMSVFLGRTEDSSNWSYSAAPTTGITGTLVGRTYTVTGMSTDAGYVDLTASRPGYDSLTSRFSVTKSRQGQGGPLISLVSSAAGFSFRDGQAAPAEQIITFTVMRQNTVGPVQFFASDDVPLTTDEGELVLSNYMLGVPGCGAGDTCYLKLSDFGDRQQVTVTAVLGELTAVQTIVRLDSSSAEAGATRNVFKGNWTSGVLYAVGDTVIKGGYGWACLAPHTALTGSNEPPVYPTASNAYWALAAVKGDDAKLAVLTASSQVFQVAADGTVSPSSIALAVAGQNLSGSPVFTVTSGIAVLTGSGEARTLAYSSMSTDQVTVKVTWDDREDFVTITKLREGTSGVTAVLDNESHTLPAGESGNVTSYAGSGTEIQVFEGSTALTASATATVSAFRIGTITQTPSALTVGEVSYSGTKVTIAAHSGMNQGIDSVVLSIPITVYRANGTSVTFTKLQTLTKAKQGVTGVDGNDAIIGVLSNESHTVPTDKDGNNGNYNGASTTLTIYKGLVDDSANWTYSVTKSNVTCTEATTSRTQTVTAMSADSGYVDITATRAGYASVTKRFSLSKAKTGTKGTDAVVGILSNESHTIATDSGGNNGVFTGATTTLTIYNGLVDDSANWTYSVTKSNVTCTEATTSRTQTVTAMSADTGYVEFTASRAGYANVVKRFSLSKSRAGVDGAQPIAVLLSNEAHVFPASNTGAVGSYSGSGTQIYVYEGNDLLIYDGVGTANGTWKVTTAVSNITVGSLTDSGTYVTVGNHSGVADGTDTSTITYTVTGKTAAGVAFSIPKQQSFTKSKAGATGAQGPAVQVTSSRALAFTATDGTLDASQANITLTADVSGVSSPTYVWSFSGFQTAPTNSGTATQTITPAQFGTSKVAFVTCTVNGTYVDKVTIVRLEKSTAEAGATNGATLGTNIDGQIDSTNIAALIASAAIGTAYIANAAITNAKIADAAITSAKIGTAAITNAKIADAAVDTLSLAGNAVTIPYYYETAALNNTTENTEVLVFTSGYVAYDQALNAHVLVTLRLLGYSQATASSEKSPATVRARLLCENSAGTYSSYVFDRTTSVFHTNDLPFSDLVQLSAGSYRFKLYVTVSIPNLGISSIKYANILVSGAKR